VTVIGLAEPLAVCPPGDAATLYEVIAEPPLEAGAVKLTVAWPSPGTADTPAGAPGTVEAAGGADGVTAFDGEDAAPVPALFVAVTVNV
jgi:hypothetical protein